MNFDDALLDIAWKNLDSHYVRFKDVDTKAVGIITITGILVTFMSKPVHSDYLSSILFMLTSLFFLMTILLCVGVIATRKYEAVSTDHLIDELAGEPDEKQIRRLIGTIAAAESDVCMAANSKAKVLRFAIFSLGFSLILLIIYSLSTFR